MTGTRSEVDDSGRRTERSGRRVRVKRPDVEPTPTKTTGGAELAEGPRELARKALDTRGGRRLVPGDDRRWDPDSSDLRFARNAHHSNTSEEMGAALDERYNWLEGDLRVDGDGTLVMAHDSEHEDDGLTLDEWLTIGAASERGLKVDVKEDEALPALLDALEASDIPDGRLMINVQARQVDEAAVRSIRTRFPDAWIALNPRIREGQGYSEEHLEEVTRLADAAGGRVTFPIRWDIASPESVEQLSPHGAVSIWTGNAYGTPQDPGHARSELRERGVEGMIDFGAPLSTWEQVQQRFVSIWESDAVRGARDAFDTVGDGVGWLVDEGEDLVESGLDLGGDIVSGGIDLGEDVVSGGLDVAGDIAGGARDAASHVPLVGGLFD